MSETVLLLGSGSREHALAWKLLHSSKVSKVYVAPGNGGIKTLEKVVAVDIDIKDINKVVNWCRLNKPNLVVVGPEDPLDRGIADELDKISVPCFGPKRGAAKIECDKSFAKDFMKRHDIPTARYQSFSDAKEAKDFVKYSEFNALVVKVSGLAAGKGVIVADNKDEAYNAIDSILLKKSFGSAGNTIVVEELLEGDEVSVLAFTDGITFKTLLPSQDHKRAFENDKGPNTGGMGAYAPYPFLNKELLKTIEKDVLQKAIDGLRQEGHPFVGLLYAGLMLTKNGPKVIEFNCRFGDPETQSILPLLDSDLYEICLSCSQQNLKSIDIKWKDKSVCGIVVASEGYPDSPIKGQIIEGINDAIKEGLLVFHGSTQYKDNKFYNSGGRVLSVVAVENNLETAVNKALKGVALIKIDNCFYRKDIAKKALKRLPKSLDYKSSGVDIVAGEELVNKIKKFAAQTNRPGVIDQIGGFGALFDLKNANYKDPILVSGTDGVGTKLRIALDFNKFNSVGIDLVAMCVNDILVQGAQPLFFLDYFACSKLDVDIAALVIEGIANGCYQSNCALIGGETAEMPGMYAENDFDLAGFAVGAVDRQYILPKINDIEVNDVVIGIPSSGVHSNGFSLIRKVIEVKGIKYTDFTPFDTSLTFGDVLLEPTKLYVKSLLPAINSLKIKALSHITGGGLIENIPRILPKDRGVLLDASQWKVHDIFKWIQREGNINSHEMLKTFNCGLGMICIVSKTNAQSVIEIIEQNGETAHIVGQVIERKDEAVIVNNFPISPPNELTIPKKKRVAVLLSGSGTNFQAIVDYVNKNTTNTAIDLVLVISDKKNAQGLVRAENAGIPTKVVIKKKVQTREEYDESVNKVLLDHSIDIVCLAGYMRILSESFVNSWLGRMINIHPSILPLFKGLDAYKQALESKVRITGCTVHFVTPEMDCGPIIAQKSVPIKVNDTLEALQERGKGVEHQIYAPSLELLAQEKIVLSADGKQIVWKI